MARLRNFWVEVNVDGRATDVAVGPVGRDGGFTLTIKQRDAGGVAHVMTVRGFVTGSGALRTEAVLVRSQGQCALAYETDR